MLSFCDSKRSELTMAHAAWKVSMVAPKQAKHKAQTSVFSHDQPIWCDSLSKLIRFEFLPCFFHY